MKTVQVPQWLGNLSIKNLKAVTKAKRIKQKSGFERTKIELVNIKEKDRTNIQSNEEGTAVAAKGALT